MIGWLKISAVVALFTALMGGYMLFGAQAREIAALKADKAELQGFVAGYKRAQVTELEIRVKQDDLRIRVDNAKQKITQTDPQCANAGPTVAAFRAGIIGLRTETATGADPGAKPAGTVRGTGD